MNTNEEIKEEGIICDNCHITFYHVPYTEDGKCFCDEVCASAYKLSKE